MIDGIRKELDKVLQEIGEDWTPQDREKAVAVAADLLELHGRAVLGGNVAGAMALATATLANLHSAAARSARKTVLEAVNRMIERASALLMVALKA